MKSSYWDRQAKKFDDRGIVDIDWYDLKVSLIRSYLEPEMEVLEFGCGTGLLARDICPFVKSYLAIDSSSEMIKIAKEKKFFKATDQGLKFECFNLLDIRFCQYDVVLGMNVLHLLDDVDSAVMKVSEITKRNGVVILEIPCLADNYIAIKPFVWFFSRLGLIPAVSFLKVDKVFDLMGKNGFEIVYSYSNSVDLLLVARKV